MNPHVRLLVGRSGDIISLKGRITPPTLLSRQMLEVILYFILKGFRLY